VLAIDTFAWQYNLEHQKLYPDIVFRHKPMRQKDEKNKDYFGWESKKLEAAADGWLNTNPTRTNHD